MRDMGLEKAPELVVVRRIELYTLLRLHLHLDTFGVTECVRGDPCPLRAEFGRLC